MSRQLYIFFSCALILGGCADFHKSQTSLIPSTDVERIALRNNSASLLYDLLGDEKNVSKILIIKRNSPELKQLIKAISDASRNAAMQLEQMAKVDPTLNLQALKLPAGEKATRAAIAKTKEHELLLSSGENFQFELLLTQADALSYGWHLAAIAADNSGQPAAATFKEVSANYKNLYGQVSMMLKSGTQK
jgi:hypothetical protein